MGMSGDRLDSTSHRLDRGDRPIEVVEIRQG